MKAEYNARRVIISPQDPKPVDPGEAFERAILLHQRGQLPEAQMLYSAVIQAAPQHADALHLSGVLAIQTGDVQMGTDLIRRAIRINPRHAVAHSNLGNALMRLRRPMEALASYAEALSLSPDLADVWYNRGNALRELERPAEALSSYARAIALKPDFFAAFAQRGNVLRELNEFDEAVKSYVRALSLQPDHPETLNNLGNALLDLGRADDAAKHYRRAAELKPGFIEAWFNWGMAQNALRQYGDALACFDKVLEAAPGFPRALFKRCESLLALNRAAEALECAQRGLAQHPDSPELLQCSGDALLRLKRLDDAAAGYRRLRLLAPNVPDAYGLEFWCRQAAADWSDHRQSAAEIADWVREGIPVCEPLIFLSVSDECAAQRRCAEIFSSYRYPPAMKPLWDGERFNNKRLRIGYLSSDLRDHALSCLMAGVFEQHDRGEFEVYALATRAPDGDSVLAARVREGFDRFIDLRAQGDVEAAALIRSMQIDILVDLNGYTEGLRTGILAQRPAPIQVSYLGYPATMGAAFIDYIVADHFVIPESSLRFYSEQVAFLPGCFQANDSRRPRPPAIRRTDAGLPDGLLLCSFNHTHKLNPPFFDIWLRALASAPQSSLWLLGEHPEARSNLREYAAKRGVDPSRLYFAERLPYDRHLQRLALADLFLDCLPFNAGATASDALWMNVPVLTCTGEAYAARMAGSLLTHLGLPELITTDPREYEQRLLAFVAEPARLSALRLRLAGARDRASVFDTARFTRSLEAAYRQMYARFMAHEPPKTFDVDCVNVRMPRRTLTDEC